MRIRITRLIPLRWPTIGEYASIGADGKHTRKSRYMCQLWDPTQSVFEGLRVNSVETVEELPGAREEAHDTSQAIGEKREADEVEKV